jgi:Ala-tRNA(Pro) deacylase
VQENDHGRCNDCWEFLERHHVAHEIVPHARTGSSLASARVAQVPPERVAKGVLLNADGRYLLAVTRADCHLDLDELRRQLQLPVELATREDLKSVFDDCALGAVPPLGPAYGIESVWDEALMQAPDLYFEFGDHTHLVHVHTRDYLALLDNEWHGSFSEPITENSSLWGTA